MTAAIVDELALLPLAIIAANCGHGVSTRTQEGVLGERDGRGAREGVVLGSTLGRAKKRVLGPEMCPVL